MNTKGRGNIALGRAIAHFTGAGYFAFAPIGDNSGSIDLVISPDGVKLYRVQCKYTVHVHTSILNKTGKIVYQAGLRSYTRDNEKGRATNTKTYTESDFDILFVSAPDRDWLIDWAKLCRSANPFRQTTGRTETSCARQEAPPVRVGP